MPGRTPHPRRDPRGHSWGQREPTLSGFAAADWAKSEWYRYGIDLYNAAYWWECHEIFEGLWRAAGDDSDSGRLFRALIQIAAGNLKRAVDARDSAHRLWQAGLERLARLPRVYMGIEVRALQSDVEAYAEGRSQHPAWIHLQFADAVGPGRGAAHPWPGEPGV